MAAVGGGSASWNSIVVKLIEGNIWSIAASAVAGTEAGAGDKGLAERGRLDCCGSVRHYCRTLPIFGTWEAVSCFYPPPAISLTASGTNRGAEAHNLTRINSVNR